MSCTRALADRSIQVQTLIVCFQFEKGERMVANQSVITSTCSSVQTGPKSNFKSLAFGRKIDSDLLGCSHVIAGDWKLVTRHDFVEPNTCF